MAKWVVKLDPTAIFGGARTELDLSAGQYAIDVAGIDWGDAAIKAFMAEGRFGETQVAHRVPNRTITIPLGVGLENKATQAEEIASGEEARAKLGAKVGLLQREGGVLLRQREGGQPLYADIVNATLNIPDKFGELSGVEPNTTLKLECLPDFYGDEVALDEINGEGQAIQKLYLASNPAIIFGDYPARCRIALTEEGGADQRSLIWGFQSRHPWSSNQDALAIDAKDLTRINEAVEEANGAAYSGKLVKLTAPATNTWHPFLSTDRGGSPLQHFGSFRVWARVSMWPSQRMRLVWGQGEATQLTENPPVTKSVFGWTLVDLGEIRIEQIPGLATFWRGTLQVETGGESKTVYVDRIWFQPVDESAGLLRAPGTPTLTSLSQRQTPTEAKELETGHAWTNPNNAYKPGSPAYVEGLNSFEGSKWLALEKLGFTLPTGVTVRGIEVKIPSFVAFAKEGGGLQLLVRLIKGGTGEGEAPFLNEGSSLVAGGPTSLWGLSWTYTNINATNFGVELSVVNTTALKLTAKLTGAVTIKVYYTYSSSAISEDAVLYASKHTQIRTDGVFREAGSSFSQVTQVLGDLPRIPASGLEGRQPILFIKNSRGLTEEEQDSAKDSIKAVVFYRPCFIGRI